MSFEPIVLQLAPVLFQVKGQTEQEQLLFLLQKKPSLFPVGEGFGFFFYLFYWADDSPAR